MRKTKLMWRCLVMGVLAAAVCFSLTACDTGGTEDDEPVQTGQVELSDEVKQAQQAAQEERTEYENAIRQVNVFEDAGSLTKEYNLVATYFDISTECYDEMVAYKNDVADGQIPTYVFVGKLLADAGLSQAELSLELIQVAKEFEGMDLDGVQIETGAADGFIIMAAAPNSSDITGKFSQVMKTGQVQTVDDVMELLERDLSELDAAGA